MVHPVVVEVHGGCRQLVLKENRDPAIDESDGEVLIELAVASQQEQAIWGPAAKGNSVETRCDHSSVFCREGALSNALQKMPFLEKDAKFWTLQVSLFSDFTLSELTMFGRRV